MEIYSTKQQKNDRNLLHLLKTYDIIPVLQQLNKFYNFYARVAQLVEYDLAKVGVAGSSPVSRSINDMRKPRFYQGFRYFLIFINVFSGVDQGRH